MNFISVPGGKTVQQKNILTFRNEQTQGPWIYLIAGVHGDEVEGIFVLQKLFTWIKTQEFSLPLIIIPVVNQDGYDSKQRVNANLIDLNRNLPTKDWSAEVAKPAYHPGISPLSEPENKFLVHLFEQYPPKIILSFHSWKPLLNFNGQGQVEEVAHFLGKYNNYEVAGDIGYPTPGSLGTFGPEKYGAGVLTFECPRLRDSGKTLEEIWLENETGLKKLFQTNLLS